VTAARPRILLIAEAANPEWISVPLVGWSHGRALADVADVHLVTQMRNREAIERAGLQEGRDFTAIDSERVARLTWKIASALRGDRRKGWTTQMAFNALAYYHFESLVWRAFRSRLESGEFDIVHRLTPLSPTIPSLVASRCRRLGVPFVLGPLNGGLAWPPGFGSARRAEREWLSYVRSAYKLLPAYRSTRRDAAAILVGSSATWGELPAEVLPKCFYVPENGVDPERFSSVRAHQATLPLRAVFLGRLVAYKGGDLLIEAVAPLVRRGDLVLEFLGEGPERASLEALARSLGIEKGVEFAGWIDHREVHSRLARADLLTFPSVREFGGAVALEAMAVGVAPVVPDYGGLGDIVTPETGFPVEMGTRDELIERFRETIETVVCKPVLADEKGQRAREHALRQHTWSARAASVMEVYRWVLDPREGRPDLPLPSRQTDRSP